jgi:ABC-type transport system substrate-binding protein
MGFNMSPDSGFTDLRVRQAVSMTQDRDVFASIFLGVDDYADVGVSLTPKLNTPMSPGYGPFYLDPDGPDFGPGAANLRHNIPEAVKLLDAAGFNGDNPFEFDMIWPGTRYGADWPTMMETLQAMALDAGVKINLVPLDYTTEWIAKTETDGDGLRTGGGYFRSYTKFEGPTNKSAAMMNPSGGRSTAGEWLSTFYTSGGPNNQVGDNFPELDNMVTDARGILDFEGQLEQYHAIQRYMMENVVVQPFIPRVEGTGIKWSGLIGPGDTKAWGGGALGNGNYINELIPGWSLDESLL